MAVYALLGATGGTGSAVLRCLLEEPPSIQTLKIFVRSETKLLTAFPSIKEKAPFHIDITEGTPSDNTALQACLRGAVVVFNCIATNISSSDVSVCRDTAEAIIEACTVLRRDHPSSYHCAPTVLQLRTASLNETAARSEPSWPRAIAKYCLLYIYADLTRGCDLLQDAAMTDPGLLSVIIIDPPGLHDAEGTVRTGHMLSTTKAAGQNLSYADLGAGFCEVALRRDEFRNQAVLVSATGEVRTNFANLAGLLLQGLKSRWIG